MDNMQFYTAMAKPPQQYLKPINFGALKGKYDINPQWRYEVMTEQFGPIGKGWKYDITKYWTQPMTDGQIMVFAEVSVYVNFDGEWSQAIPGVGGNMLIENQKGQLKANDEAYKMAVTDALGSALKMLGVAADVYSGRMDGSKYAHQEQVAQAAAQPRYSPAPASQPAAPAASAPKPQPTEQTIVQGIEDCIANGERSRAIKGLNILKATYPACEKIKEFELQLA